MGLTPEIFLFALFSVVSIVSAILVVSLTDPVKSAMSLIVSFFCLACLFLLQSAELIAVLEVLVYAGAIMVLFVFVIMLVENKDAPVVRPTLAARVALPVKIGAVLVVAYALVSAIRSAPLAGSAELPEGFGSVQSIGHEFFDNFLFHFELTSILLLAGIVGAVVVTKKRKAS